MKGLLAWPEEILQGRLVGDLGDLGQNQGPVSKACLLPCHLTPGDSAGFSFLIHKRKDNVAHSTVEKWVT